MAQWVKSWGTEDEILYDEAGPFATREEAEAYSLSHSLIDVSYATLESWQLISPWDNLVEQWVDGGALLEVLGDLSMGAILLIVFVLIGISLGLYLGRERFLPQDVVEDGKGDYQ